MMYAQLKREPAYCGKIIEVRMVGSVKMVTVYCTEYLTFIVPVTDVIILNAMPKWDITELRH